MAPPVMQSNEFILQQSLIEGQRNTIRAADNTIDLLHRRIRLLEQQQRDQHADQPQRPLSTRTPPSEAAFISGTSSPPVSTSLSASLRLQALAANLQRTHSEHLQREAESRLNNSRDRRQSRRQVDIVDGCLCDDSLNTSWEAQDEGESSDGDSSEEEDEDGARMGDEEKLARGIVDRNGDKIGRRRKIRRVLIGR
ncbi:hypothetical protein T439DRAFT_322916 [Meredithblackwellia eburnea MCA 4105]